MKIIVRTLVILLAAFLVVGITWGIGRSITSTGGPSGRSGDAAVAGQTERPGGEGFPPRDRPEGGGGGFFGVLEVGQHLILIAIIMAIGHVVLNALRRRFPTPAERRRRVPPSPT